MEILSPAQARFSGRGYCYHLGGRHARAGSGDPEGMSNPLLAQRRNVP